MSHYHDVVAARPHKLFSNQYKLSKRFLPLSSIRYTALYRFVPSDHYLLTREVQYLQARAQTYHCLHLGE